jgi:hypothetical protein
MTFLTTDPRFFPGSISGFGMEYTPEGRVVDTRYAVNLDQIDTCLIEHQPGQPAYALALSGTVGDTADRARCIFLLTPEGAGVLVDRIVGLAGIISPVYAREIAAKINSFRSLADQETEIFELQEVPEIQEAPDEEKRVA